MSFRPGKYATPEGAGIDVTSLLPASTVTTPTTTDFSSFVSERARWVKLRIRGRTSTTAKVFRARRGGDSDTGTAADKAEIAPIGTVSMTYTDAFIVHLDSSRQAEFWWSSTATHSFMNLYMDSYGEGADDAISPRLHLLETPVDVSSELPALSIRRPTYATTDFSAYVPDGADGLLLRRRCTRDTNDVGQLNMKEGGTSEVFPCVSKQWHQLLVPDASGWTWHITLPVSMNASQEVDLSRDGGAPPSAFTEETLTLLGYTLGGGGGRFTEVIPVDAPADATSLLPADSTTSPTASDFSSLISALGLPSWLTVGAIELYLSAETATVSKHLHARKTGLSITSDVLTQVAECAVSSAAPKGVSFVVPVDSSGQADLWWDVTTATTSSDLRLVAVYPDYVVF